MLAEGREESTVARALGRTQRRKKRKNFYEARGEKEEHDVSQNLGEENSIKAGKRSSQNPLVGWPTGFGHQRLLVNLVRAVFKSGEGRGLPPWV